MSTTNFHKILLPTDANLFSELLESANFESTGKGRLGNHLVHVSENGIPIVRTTTKYTIPTHNFSGIHHAIVSTINDEVQQGNTNFPVLEFNNALIEVYNSTYKKMKYHSDQSLDLADDSYIGLFSCYERPEELSNQSLRKLKIQNKISGEESKFLLEHQSVVLFSTKTNTQFLHKIVLETPQHQQPSISDNRWLGLTFRKSKTFIQFKNDQPYFANGKALELASDSQRQEFYKLRGEENRSMDFVYPALNYTLSKGDLLRPYL